jgi:rhodanese-related sulfurtransferase
MPSNRISPEEANARVLAGEPVVFIDARNPKAWAESDRKIPGALRIAPITPEAISAQEKDIGRDSTVIAYCT